MKTTYSKTKDGTMISLVQSDATDLLILSELFNEGVAGKLMNTKIVVEPVFDVVGTVIGVNLTKRSNINNLILKLYGFDNSKDNLWCKIGESSAVILIGSGVFNVIKLGKKDMNETDPNGLLHKFTSIGYDSKRKGLELTFEYSYTVYADGVQIEEIPVLSKKFFACKFAPKISTASELNALGLSIDKKIGVNNNA